jgi:cell division protein FtsB
MSLRFNFFIMLLLLLLILLQYQLWLGHGGIKEMLKIKKSLALQSEENLKLKKQNDKLLFQIKRLHHSQDAIEFRARNELGMVKKGETFYQIVK